MRKGILLLLTAWGTFLPGCTDSESPEGADIGTRTSTTPDPVVAQAGSSSSGTGEMDTLYWAGVRDTSRSYGFESLVWDSTASTLLACSESGCRRSGWLDLGNTVYPGWFAGGPVYTTADKATTAGLGDYLVQDMQWWQCLHSAGCLIPESAQSLQPSSGWLPFAFLDPASANPGFLSVLFADVVPSGTYYWGEFNGMALRKMVAEAHSLGSQLELTVPSGTWYFTMGTDPLSHLHLRGVGSKATTLRGQFILGDSCSLTSIGLDGQNSSALSVPVNAVFESRDLFLRGKAELGSGSYQDLNAEHVFIPDSGDIRMEGGAFTSLSIGKKAKAKLISVVAENAAVQLDADAYLDASFSELDSVHLDSASSARFAQSFIGAFTGSGSATCILSWNDYHSWSDSCQ